MASRACGRWRPKTVPSSMLKSSTLKSSYKYSMISRESVILKSTSVNNCQTYLKVTKIDRKILEGTADKTGTEIEAVTAAAEATAIGKEEEITVEAISVEAISAAVAEVLAAAVDAKGIKMHQYLLAIWTTLSIKERYKRCLSLRECGQQASDCSMMIKEDLKDQPSSISCLRTLQNRRVVSTAKN